MNLRDSLVHIGLMPRGRFESRRLLDHANGAPCMHCGQQDGTTVAAHANAAAYNKGAHHKADDVFVAYLCARCHAWLDQGRGMDPTEVWSDNGDDKLEVWRRAHALTLVWLFANGKVRVA